MIIAEPGHYYFLDVEHSAQPVHFRHKACPNENPEMHLLGALRGGTTCDEVLSMLLDRVEHLHSEAPAWELAQARQLLRQAQAVLALRSRPDGATGLVVEHNPPPLVSATFNTGDNSSLTTSSP
jgi:hypothetical protein